MTEINNQNTFNQCQDIDLQTSNLPPQLPSQNPSLSFQIYQNNLSDSLMLISQIKQTIQNYYSTLTGKELAQKVRAEIIPVLIKLFYQELSKSQKIIQTDGEYLEIDQNRNESKKILLDNNYLMNRIENSLTHLDEKQNIYVGKQNEEFGMQTSRKYIFLRSQDMSEGGSQNIPLMVQNFIKLLQQKQSQNPNQRMGVKIEEVIKKIISIFKLEKTFQSILNKDKQQSCFQLFSIYKQGRQKNERLEKALTLLERHIKMRNNKHTIDKFYTNHKMTKKFSSVSKILQKFYNKKINEYSFRFVTNLIVNANKGEQMQVINGAHWQNFNKIKSMMITRAVCTLQHKYHRNLNTGMNKIRNYNYYFNNLWRSRWVRRLAYCTNANLQTSYWRLKNYCNNQNTNNSKQFQHQSGKLPKQQKEQQQAFSQNELTQFSSRNDVMSFAGDNLDSRPGKFKNNLSKKFGNRSEHGSKYISNNVLETRNSKDAGSCFAIQSSVQLNINNLATNSNVTQIQTQTQTEIHTESQIATLTQSSKQNYHKLSVLSHTSTANRATQDKNECRRTTKQILDNVSSARNSMQIQSIIFTREQKIQILWQQLQHINQFLQLGLIFQAFSNLENKCLNSARKNQQQYQCKNKCDQQQNIQQLKQCQQQQINNEVNQEYHSPQLLRQQIGRLLQQIIINIQSKQFIQIISQCEQNNDQF